MEAVHCSLRTAAVDECLFDDKCSKCSKITVGVTRAEG
jgi:hypothetical protein